MLLSSSLRKKAAYGKMFDSNELIQIPVLSYFSKKEINENPYILLNNIRKKYEEVKGKAEEMDFWESVLIKFENGKVNGYGNESVYEIEGKRFIVRSLSEKATLLFWGPDATLDDDEEEWLWDNAEEYELYIEGNPTHFNIYIMEINNRLKPF